ncbi:hypothetical protein CRE_24794 [Caenorhabditis remanei]|uniref:C2H2-type domain-containing protein n=1 Tax=Caenorhabditis remanei TaxID=31234 RepID=E3NCV4_CAERE|nr:hypothetical protein CRE_24794 [Caenorhabditis remanei]
MKTDESTSSRPPLEAVHLSGLIHHQMNHHNLDAQCHLCLQKFATRKAFQEHHELVHTHNVVKCVFCKSAFDQPLEMKNGKWDDFFSHLYGEILYSRLAEHEERANSTNNNK